jgi:two-component system, chemotaxis family, chemotaxis protein CheY
MKSLVVEDDVTSRMLLVQILKPYGPVEAASNGLFALEAVRKACGAGAPFALICLDIMMPELDGQAALRKIRAIEASFGIEGLDGARVIMTTALDDKENILQAFNAQCEGYLVKPISPSDLQDLLKKFGML